MKKLVLPFIFLITFTFISCNDQASIEEHPIVGIWINTETFDNNITRTRKIVFNDNSEYGISTTEKYEDGSNVGFPSSPVYGTYSISATKIEMKPDPNSSSDDPYEIEYTINENTLTILSSPDSEGNKITTIYQKEE